MSDSTILSPQLAILFQSLSCGWVIAPLVEMVCIGVQQMVLKIERHTAGKCVTLLLSSRMQAEHLETVQAETVGIPQLVLDLELVDREAVCFLANCEASGAKLRHCSPYIRNWINKERVTAPPK
jgi:hypothetical protein